MGGGGRSGRVGGVNDLMFGWLDEMVLHSEALFMHLWGWMELSVVRQDVSKRHCFCLRWRYYE